MTIHLAGGLAERSGRVLLVASRYPNHPQPLWNLPGGRQRDGELLPSTAIREILEETGLRARVIELAYTSESYDGNTHFLSAIFRVEVAGRLRPPRAPDHIAAAAWVPIPELAERIAARVVREPLVAYLRGMLPLRYAGFEEAGITIQWPTDRDA